MSVILLKFRIFGIRGWPQRESEMRNLEDHLGVLGCGAWTRGRQAYVLENGCDSTQKSITIASIEICVGWISKRGRSKWWLISWKQACINRIVSGTFWVLYPHKDRNKRFFVRVRDKAQALLKLAAL